MEKENNAKMKGGYSKYTFTEIGYLISILRKRKIYLYISDMKFVVK